MITNDQFITEKIESVFFRLQCMPCFREHALFTDRPSLVRDGTYQATGITGGPKGHHSGFSEHWVELSVHRAISVAVVPRRTDGQLGGVCGTDFKHLLNGLLEAHEVIIYHSLFFKAILTEYAD